MGERRSAFVPTPDVKPAVDTGAPAMVETAPSSRPTRRSRAVLYSATNSDSASGATATLVGSSKDARVPTPSAHAFAPDPASVVVTPVATTTRRTRRPARSAAKTTLPSGSAATPQTELNSAATPVASR